MKAPHGAFFLSGKPMAQSEKQQRSGRHLGYAYLLENGISINQNGNLAKTQIKSAFSRVKLDEHFPNLSKFL